MQSRGQTETVGKLAEVVTGGHGKTSELKSQHDQKLNPQTGSVNLGTVKGSRKTLPARHPTALSKSHEKLKGDKSSGSFNPITKRKRVAELIGKKCLVWCKKNTVTTGTQEHKCPS